MSIEPGATAHIKLDLKKELAYLYAPSTREVVMVEVPDMSFLMVDGMGDPNTAAEYRDAVEALYAVAYTAKFMLKKEAAIEYPVMPLEGLWWSEGEWQNTPRDQWHWTMMIMQPECVTSEWFARALEQTRQKKHLPALDRMRLERLREGPAVQIMYVGPYRDEGPTIEQIHSYIHDHGYELRGKHHEIYVSDPRRVAPEKMRTVIRQPARAS